MSQHENIEVTALHCRGKVGGSTFESIREALILALTEERTVWLDLNGKRYRFIPDKVIEHYAANDMGALAEVEKNA